MREWKKFIDHDKILEILKNINTEGETEDQKESKKNEDKEDDADNEKENTGKIDKANIIDIISNYFEEEFDLVKDYDIQKEVQEWLLNNFMKDDKEEGGHPYMEVLGVLEKKLRNFDKEAIF
jgi:hypothetical protein